MNIKRIDKNTSVGKNTYTNLKNLSPRWSWSGKKAIDRQQQQDILGLDERILALGLSGFQKVKKDEKWASGLYIGLADEPPSLDISLI